jgi:hypothetical protein
MSPTDRQPVLPCWVGPVTAAVAWHAALLAGAVLAHGGGPSTLVCAAEDRAGRPPFEAVVSGGGDGYDGQFYYALARGPWRARPQWLDAPAYRHTRILYPALAWLFSLGGDPRLLLWVMPALNLAAVAGLAWVGVRLAVAHGLSPWWGLGLPLAVNDGMGALRNLTEPLSALALAGMLVGLMLRSGGGVIVLCAAAAVFTRQQNALIVAAVAAGAWWSGRRGLAAGLAAVLGLLGVWALALSAAYPGAPLLPSDGGMFGWPLEGFLGRCRDVPRLSGLRNQAMDTLRLLHLAVQVGLAAYLLTRPCDVNVKATMLAGALLAVSAGSTNYADPWAFLRLFAWLPLGVWLAAAQLRRRWCLVALLPAGIWSLLNVASMVVQALR